MEEFKEGFTYLQEQISYSQKVEDRLRRESLALEQAGEQLEQELHRVEKTEDQVRMQGRVDAQIYDLTDLDVF